MSGMRRMFVVSCIGMAVLALFTQSPSRGAAAPNGVRLARPHGKPFLSRAVSAAGGQVSAWLEWVCPAAQACEGFPPCNGNEVFTVSCPTCLVEGKGLFFADNCRNHIDYDVPLTCTNPEIHCPRVKWTQCSPYC